MCVCACVWCGVVCMYMGVCVCAVSVCMRVNVCVCVWCGVCVHVHVCVYRKAGPSVLEGRGSPCSPASTEALPSSSDLPSHWTFPFAVSCLGICQLLPGEGWVTVSKRRTGRRPAQARVPVSLCFLGAGPAGLGHEPREVRSVLPWAREPPAATLPSRHLPGCSAG